MRSTLAFALVLSIAGCDRRRDVLPATDDAGQAAPVQTPTIASVAMPPADYKPVNVIVPGDRYAVVVRGALDAGERLAMLFMAGMCMHPRGYAGAFEHTAAERGELIALQADVSCGGGPDSPVRMWSNDLDALDHRIDAAFAASGFGAPKEVVVIGYSQGAERAEQLMARWPKKYSRAILIASPHGPSPKILMKARAVVLMAGTFDGSSRACAPRRRRSRAMERARSSSSCRTPITGRWAIRQRSRCARRSISSRRDIQTSCGRTFGRARTAGA